MDNLNNGMLKYYVGGLALIALMLYLLYGRGGANPHAEIEAMLRSAADTVENENVLGLSSHIAVNFSSPEGVDRAAVLAQAKGFFEEAQNIRVSFEHIKHQYDDLPPDADSSRALIIAIVTGRTNDGSAFQGVTADGADTFILGFEKKRGDWKIVYADRLSQAELEKYMSEGGI